MPLFGSSSRVVRADKSLAIPGSLRARLRRATRSKLACRAPWASSLAPLTKPALPGGLPGPPGPTGPCGLPAGLPGRCVLRAIRPPREARGGLPYNVPPIYLPLPIVVENVLISVDKWVDFCG